MKDYVLSFPIFEKTIGIENIYKKYYSDIPTQIFNQLINLDPTLPKHKDRLSVDKPGRYARWIMREYRNGHFDMYIKHKDLQKLKFLREELKLLGTSWLKKRHGKNIDILQYSYPQLTNILGKYLEQYLDETAEESGEVKVDLLYEDDTWNIFVPLNAETSKYLCGKETQWCSNYEQGYEMWSNAGYIFYRFIPKINPYRKMRMSWKNSDQEFSWAFGYTYSNYHVYGIGNPFDVKESDTPIHNELVTNIKSIPTAAKKEIYAYHDTVSEPITIENFNHFSYRTIS